MPDRGFGFITDDSGGPDIFMHVTALRGMDPDNLRVGERLTFDVERYTPPASACPIALGPFSLTAP